MRLRFSATCCALFFLSCGSAGARDVAVSTATELATAISAAQPGDRLLLAPGTYAPAGNLTCSANGSPAAPILIRATIPGSALIRFTGGVVEGFRVSGAHWHFEGLVVEGACALDANCEHAFHLFGDADGTQIRGSVLRDFNAQIKSNIGGAGGFPDDVRIERNSLYDTRARQTSNPVTKIDVVGGRRWLIRANTIYDFEKAQGNLISYAAFLKGNSRDGVFERNLVICQRDFAGGVRIGLSLGGGGTSPDSICEDGSCDPEHQNGVLRNNLVLNCSDVGIYINRGANSLVQHNTLFATTGIDIRFATSSADLRNNLLGGAIRFRDGGTGSSAGNLAGVAAATFRSWFTDPDGADFSLLSGSAFIDQGVAAPLVTDDYCGRPRTDGLPDIGALEFADGLTCRTEVAGGFGERVFRDGFGD